MQNTLQATAVIEEQKTINPELIYLELATIIKNERESSWEIAKRINQLYHAGELRNTISEKLKRFGVVLDPSSISVYNEVWEYYHNVMDLFDEVKDEPLYKLYYIQQIFEEVGLNRERVRELLKEVKGMTRQEAVRYLKEKFGLETTREMISIRVHEAVAERFNEWRANVLAAAQTAGENIKEVSPTTAMEVGLEILLSIPHENLVKLWLSMHGEGNNDSE